MGVEWRNRWEKATSYRTKQRMIVLEQIFRLLHFNFRRVADWRPLVGRGRRLGDEDLSLHGDCIDRALSSGRVLDDHDLLRFSLARSDAHSVPPRSRSRKVDGHAL